MRRNVVGGEVIASSLDMDVESHVRLSQLVIDRARQASRNGTRCIFDVGFHYPIGSCLQ